MENKGIRVTKKDMFTALLNITEVAENEELVKFITHEIALLDKKALSKKPTDTQLANRKFQRLIVDHLKECGASLTIKELQAQIPELADLTSQRMNHLLIPLTRKEDDPETDDCPLVKIYVKKVPHYGYYFTE
jgi:hypothetical protein